MSDSEAGARVAAAAASLVPPLTERLARLGLAEIEVQRGDVRVRVVADGSANVPAPAARSGKAGTAMVQAADHRMILRSPAVGFFVAGSGLAEGLEVSAGGQVGHVDMLGVRHEVRAEGAGRVVRLAVEDGQVVEYGQELVEMEPA